MPFYEYTCATCGFEDEFLEKLSSVTKVKSCPKCKKAKSFKRQISAPSFQLKGSGWYVTDFKDNNSGKAEKTSTEKVGENPISKDKTDKATKAEKPASKLKDKQSERKADKPKTKKKQM